MQVWEGVVTIHLHVCRHIQGGWFIPINSCNFFSEVVILMFLECSYTAVGMHSGGGGGVGKNTCLAMGVVGSTHLCRYGGSG